MLIADTLENERSRLLELSKFTPDLYWYVLYVFSLIKVAITNQESP